MPSHAKELRFSIRELKRADVDGYLQLLAQLSDIGDKSLWTETTKNKVYDFIDGVEQTKIYVATDNVTDQLLGAMTIVMEPKFLRGGSIVAHVEDVVVSQTARKRGIGRSLLQYAVHLAEKVGAYKVILDCDQNLIDFYKACGFCQSSVQMRHNVQTDKKAAFL